MFHFVDKIAESFLLEAFDHNIIVKNIKEPAFLARLSPDLKQQWKFPIKESGGHYTISGLADCIYFDGDGSLFISKQTGQQTNKEAAFYFARETGLSVFFKLGEKEVLYVHYQGHQVQIPNTSGLKWFYGGFLLQAPYGSKQITCHSMTDGSLVWQLGFAELSGSEKMDLYSDLLFDDGRLYFFLSDANNISITFIVDCKTGSVIHQDKQFGGKLTRVDDRLYVVDTDIVKVMDTQTFKTQTIALGHLLDPKNISLIYNRFAMNGHELYFSNGNQPGVGVLNVAQAELLWYEDLTVSHPELRNITHLQVQGNRLYLAGANRTLYIFERDL